MEKCFNDCINNMKMLDNGCKLTKNIETCWKYQETQKSEQNVCAAPSSAEHSVYPLLADLLADFSKNIHITEEGHEVVTIEDITIILSKYFS